MERIFSTLFVYFLYFVYHGICTIDVEKMKNTGVACIFLFFSEMSILFLDLLCIHLSAMMTRINLSVAPTLETSLTSFRFTEPSRRRLQRLSVNLRSSPKRPWRLPMFVSTPSWTSSSGPRVYVTSNTVSVSLYILWETTMKMPRKSFTLLSNTYKLLPTRDLELKTSKNRLSSQYNIILISYTRFHVG